MFILYANTSVLKSIFLSLLFSKGNYSLKHILLIIIIPSALVIGYRKQLKRIIKMDFVIFF